MIQSMRTRKQFVKGLAGGALAFAGLAGIGSAFADEEAKPLAVEAIFVGADKQLLVEQDNDQEHLDTIWIYFNDMTFTQYAFHDDKCFVFSTGTYAFENNGSFIVNDAGEFPGNIVITRNQKFQDGAGLVAYDSTHSYDLNTLGFIQVFPVSKTGMPSGEEQLVGMPNPWREATDAFDAAQGAGLAEFDVPMSLEKYGIGTYKTTYYCMKGLAEVRYDTGAAEITVRKGVPVENNDVSGDYNQYEYSWTQVIDEDDEIICFGNIEGVASKVIWEEDGFDFAIMCRGFGGESDYGLTAEALYELVDDIE